MRISGRIQNVNAEAEIEVIFVVEDAIEPVHSDVGKEIEKPVSCTWKGDWSSNLYNSILNCSPACTCGQFCHWMNKCLPSRSPRPAMRPFGQRLALWDARRRPRRWRRSWQRASTPSTRPGCPSQPRCLQRDILESITIWQKQMLILPLWF